MPGHRLLAIVGGGALCAGLFHLSVGSAGAQQARLAPTENRGVTYEALVGLDLGNQIDLPGRQFRVRRLTMEPGGYVGLHEHRNRPAMIYVVQGQVTDHHEGGGEPREYRAGQVVAETVDLRHWIENTGGTPTVLVVVDLFKP